MVCFLCKRDYWMTLEYVGRYYVQYPRKLLYGKKTNGI